MGWGGYLGISLACCLYVGFFPCECKCLFSMPLRQGTNEDCCLCLRGKQQFRILGLLEFLGGVLKGAPPKDSVVLLGDFNADVGFSAPTFDRLGTLSQNGPCSAPPLVRNSTRLG